MKSREEIIKLLVSCKEEVRHKFKTEILGVFGSYSRNQQRQKSDLDVLVSLKEGATLFDWTEMDSYLEEKLQLKIDSVPEDGLHNAIRAQVFNDLVRV